MSFFYNVLCLITTLFLASCSTNKPVTGVCKSCNPYYVRDGWHYPQKHYDYDKIGLASWYGPRFHGKPKPHGEKYNQYEMTAAHKTLPIPTIALVTNLETGKNIKVLIDDRGPFVYDGRIIDLSVAAAQEIGVYKKGTAKVRVTALEEESAKFATHLAKFKRAKCPKGRRWVKIFQDDVSNDKLDLVSTVYKFPDQYLEQKNAPMIQNLTYTPQKKMLTPQRLGRSSTKKRQDSIAEILTINSTMGKKASTNQVDSLLHSLKLNKQKNKAKKIKFQNKKHKTLNVKIKRLSLKKEQSAHKTKQR